MRLTRSMGLSRRAPTAVRSRLARLIRLPLRLIPSSAVVPILSGPGRGMRWIVGSAPHGAWLGFLERDKLTPFVARLQSGMTVWDIGANVGLYTLPSARAVGPAGHVVAFEPMPRNLGFLRRHLTLNGLEGVAVCAVAVSDATGTVRMAEGDSPSEFHAEAGGSVEVKAVTIGDAITELQSRYPGIKERLVDDKGEVRRFVNVYVNEEDIRFLQNQQTPLKEGDEISIIPAIAGG